MKVNTFMTGPCKGDAILKKKQQKKQGEFFFYGCGGKSSLNGLDFFERHNKD